MNYNKFFAMCAQEGISASQLSYTKTTSLSFSLFHGEIDNYSISSQSKLSGKGIYNNQLGSGMSEKISSQGLVDILHNIKESALVLQRDSAPVIFKGSEKYHKKNMYNKGLSLVTVDEKLQKLHELEQAAKEYDSCVSEVQVSYSEEEEAFELANSYGLNLKSKSNYYYYALEVVCKKGDEVKTSYEIFLESDFAKFDPRALAKKAVEKCLAKFNGISLAPKAYRCVLNQEVVATFLAALVGNGFSAENVQRQSSLLVGKLNQKVFSSKVTLFEKPLLKNFFFRYFDDEGVATHDKVLINKGVVATYLYNLEAAQREGRESTGNGFGGSIAYTNLFLKPGRHSEEEVIGRVANGVYITSVTGTHSGLNPQSGDFSLEAEGFKIENGKIVSPLTLITVGGNIYQLFNDVIDVANNSELQLNSITSSSVLVKRLKVSSL